MDLATGEDVDAWSGFMLVRAPRNGDLPRDYLRTFEIVGRDGLAHLAYGTGKPPTCLTAVGKPRSREAPSSASHDRGL